MRNILIPVFLLFSISPAAAQTANDPVSEIQNVLKAYDKAWNSKNVRGVSSVLSDDYVYFTSTGSINDRKRTLEFLASPDYKLTFVERREVVIHRRDKTFALVSSRWTGRGTYGTEVINDDQRCGIVFLKIKSEWKIVSEHCVQIVSN
jgi:ketosteroid isomerase-like protein